MMCVRVLVPVISWGFPMLSGRDVVVYLGWVEDAVPALCRCCWCLGCCFATKIGLGC